LRGNRIGLGWIICVGDLVSRAAPLTNGAEPALHERMRGTWDELQRDTKLLEQHTGVSVEQARRAAAKNP
jgi:hypothetical protein